MGSDTINTLLSKQKWAGIDSVTFSDGRMVLMNIEFYSGNKYIISPLVDGTIASYVKYNAEFLTPYDIFSTCDFEYGKVSVGDGSAEGNGIVFRLNNNNELVWFAFFENSGPFNKVEIIDNREIRATHEQSNVVWSISITNPLKIKLIYS